MARPGLQRNRKWPRLLRALDGDVAVARGSLELIWDVAYENGDDVLGDSDDVELAAHWRGEPGRLTQALLGAGGEGEPGFIEEVPERPGRYRVHDLWDHAPEYVVKRAAREAERTERGEALSKIRSQAGKKGAAARWQANGKIAEVCHLPMASGVPPAPAPAPAPAPTPARTPTRMANGGGRAGGVKMGPLGVSVVQCTAEGLNSGLLPLGTQAEADEFEQRIAAQGGFDSTIDLLASMCRKRDTKPYAVRLLLDWLRDVQVTEAPAPPPQLAPPPGGSP